MEERLNDIYNNPQYDDNTVIIRSLNTFIKNGSSKVIHDNLTHYTELFTELLQTSPIVRPDIKYIVEQIKLIQTNNTFGEFKKVLSNVINQDFTIYKYIYILCYCRTVFELYYRNDIRYTKPDYAIREALGDEPWNVFLKAFKNNEYAYLNNIIV